jgi:class 3 adenylate cyclase/Tfp pilus assembly protein PilF
MVLGTVSFFFFLPQAGQCQVLAELDSLEQVFIEDRYEEDQLFFILKKLAQHHEDIDKKVFYSGKLISASIESDSIERQFDGYIARGHALSNKGEFKEALNDYFSASKLANEIGKDDIIAIVNLAIAGGYSRLGNYKQALDYYRKSLVALKDNNTLKYGYTLFNMGDQYLKLSKPDSAMIYFNLANPIFEDNKDVMGMAYTQGSKGKAYQLLEKDDLALKNLNEAIASLSKLDDYYNAICEYQLDISEIYLKQGALEAAEENALLSLELAEKNRLKPEIRDAYLLLSKIYERRGDKDLAFKNYQNYVQLKDSLVNISSVRQLAEMRTDFELAQKQLEVDLLNNQKRTQRIIMYSLGFVVLLIALFYRRISKEKDRSDLLLLNILPSKTAKELKEKGRVEARKFKAVTVMFTDFEGFTRHSQDLTPEKLVKSVDYYFSAFDKIIEKYGLEKIKTIGDAYMCTGGLIQKGPFQPIKVIEAAFEILEFVENEQSSNENEIAHFRIRIGINTGPVVGGVVGTKKFAYDIWGDTVNVAARMESNSKAGRINISENTYELVKDRFDCEYRGEIDVKNKGMMKMYFVHGPKDSSSRHKENSVERKNTIKA